MALRVRIDHYIVFHSCQHALVGARRDSKCRFLLCIFLNIGLQTGYSRAAIQVKIAAGRFVSPILALAGPCTRKISAL